MLLRVFNGASFSLVIVIGLLWSLSIPLTVNAEEEFCPEEASVDLNNAKQNASGYFAESGHFFPIEIVRNEEDGLRGCICDVKPCISLCPLLMDKFGKRFSGANVSINLTEISMFRTTNLTSEDAANLSLGAEQWFHFVTGDTCKKDNYYKLYLDGNETVRWHFFENGSLFSPLRNDTKILLDWRNYCLWKEPNYTTYIPLICLAPPSDLFHMVSWYPMVLFIGALISVPLLIATIFVYSVLPQLQNIHGKTLSRYLACLLVETITRVIRYMYPSISHIKVVCSIHGFIVHFSVLASFLWLNVMCFDMWWKFRGYGSIRNRGRIEDRGRFIGYSIYAWGTTVVASAISLIGFRYLSGIPVSDSRMQSCWFHTFEENIFCILLIFLSIICNACLFVSISLKLIQHQINSRRQLSSCDSKRHDDNQPQLLSVNFKLFIIMGISWPTTVILTFWKPPIYVRYFTTLLNELQGIPIFFVLVCKKKIWQSLKMRFKW